MKKYTQIKKGNDKKKTKHKSNEKSFSFYSCVFLHLTSFFHNIIFLVSLFPRDVDIDWAYFYFAKLIKVVILLKFSKSDLHDNFNLPKVSKLTKNVLAQH